MKESNTDFDVIIIGSGIGGLTLASYLANVGIKVIVLEKNSTIGGYLGEFKRKNFRFETSLHAIDGCEIDGPTFHLMKECGISDKVELIKPKYLYRAIYPDYDISIPQRDSYGYSRILERLFPQEKKNIIKCFNDIKSIFKNICFCLSKENIKKGAPLTLYSNATTQKLLDKHISDKRLKSVIAQYWMYLGLPPESLSAYYFSYVWYDYSINGSFYPKGGSITIINALADNITKHGSKIKVSSEVEKILIDKNNVAKGVQLKTGETVYGHYVVSNVNIHTTFYNLLNLQNICIPYQFKKKLSKLNFSVSAVQIYLGLNKALKDIGIDDYEMIINPTYDIKNQFEAALKNDFNRASISMTIYSNIDRSFCTERQSAMSIFTFANYDFWKKISKRDQYLKEKNRITNSIIKQCERYIPNLSRYIEIKETSTPITMEKYTSNYRGAIYGLSQIPAQSGFRRIPQELPFLKKFYLVGAGTRPGHGVGGVMHSAHNIYKRIINSEETFS